MEEYKLETRIKYLEDEGIKNEQEHKDFMTRFETIGKDGVRMEERFLNIMSTLNQMSCTLNELKSKDGKYWQTMVTTVIAVVVTAAVTWFIK